MGRILKSAILGGVAGIFIANGNFWDDLGAEYRADISRSPRLSESEKKEYLGKMIMGEIAELSLYAAGSACGFAALATAVRRKEYE